MVATWLSYVLADAALDAVTANFLGFTYMYLSSYFFLLLPPCAKIMSDDQHDLKNVIMIDFFAWSPCQFEILPVFCFVNLFLFSSSTVRTCCFPSKKLGLA